MTLFQSGDFILHSGSESAWKIDCDALTIHDWSTLAKMIANKVRFGRVTGIPMGGWKLADALKPYATDGDLATLIVDDVLTTGKSMWKAKGEINGKVVGVVVFARDKCPHWVFPIFELSYNWWEVNND